ncbi:MAG: hypothetical protein H8E03_00750 [Pelagibacteraceae bacterium]|nr:hypothetical protein [Pelagibacteraceae bacterium]
MALNAKGGVKIVKGKAYVHPLSPHELEFLLNLLATAEHKGSDLQKVLQVTYKLREEYKLFKEHLEE